MKKKRLILWIAVILTLAFIFGQSLIDQEASVKESSVVQEKIVQPVHEAVTGKETLSYNIRDIAHITEFLVLGLELLLLLRDRKIPIRLLRAVSYCGCVALIDESIQYFSGRAPQVVDIWYDITGSVVGVFIALLIVLIVERLNRHKEQEG